MLRNYSELKGTRYGMLTLVEVKGKNYRGRTLIEFKCNCGKSVEHVFSDVNSGNTKSCGCMAGIGGKLRKLPFGGSQTREYKCWYSMMYRCYSKKCYDYRHYGGRGIIVCERWQKYENFRADMGEAPDNKSIDRINVNGNYEPSNCRWATTVEQANNRTDRQPRNIARQQ